MITIYTDGACKGNPGPGGYGAIIKFTDGTTQQLSGGNPDTTNNRMELFAVIVALESIELNSVVTLYSDSKYVIDGITKWIHGWYRSNWKNNTVKNIDLWKRLGDISKQHTIDYQWIKAHNGNEYNELVDQLACASVVYK
jgi:ribonuclease HI